MFAGRLLELCWKFAGSCKHLISWQYLACYTCIYHVRVIVFCF